MTAACLLGPALQLGAALVVLIDVDPSGVRVLQPSTEGISRNRGNRRVMTDETRGQMTERKRVLAKKLDAAGWGLFFIWIGIAVLASLGWGVGLLGVGIITLGGQLARKYLGLPVEGFGLVIGALFFCGGVWELLGLRLGKAALPGALVPILCIIAGAMLLLSALLRRPANRTAR